MSKCLNQEEKPCILTSIILKMPVHQLPQIWSSATLSEFDNAAKVKELSIVTQKDTDISHIHYHTLEGHDDARSLITKGRLCHALSK